MGFAKLSENERKAALINLSNTFVTEYLPAAPDNYVKVYLTGLSLAMTDPENELETIANVLFTEQGTVTDAFAYWEEQGLVHIASDGGGGKSVEYLPVVPRARQIRKFSKEKYRTFNDQLHVLMPSRNILPGEYNEYYTVMETYNIEVEAMLTVVGYCLKLKGGDVGYPYIVAVARNLAKEGCTTFDRVNERLSELDLYSGELKAVMKALGLKKAADHEDKRLYDKWTKTFGFGSQVVVGVAKKVKKGGMSRLDALLTKYYELRLFSLSEITDYEQNRDKLYALTRGINRIIGVYYEQLDYIIETYVTGWLSMGFDEEALTRVAEYCFRRGMRTLDAMNDTLTKLYKAGCVSLAGINEYVSQAVRGDEEIKTVLSKAGVQRLVTSRDRDYYRTWTFTWGMSSELIMYAAELSAGKNNQVAYLNTVLASWHEKKITSLDEAKKQQIAPSPAPQSGVITRSFSADELNAAFDKLNEELL